VAGRLVERAGRPVNFFAITVPQYQRDLAYFEPLRSLNVPADTELYFALVPYHPEEQAEGTTEDQVRLVDENLGDRPWGICTECGMARAEREEIPTLLDLHREILDARRSAGPRLRLAAVSPAGHRKPPDRAVLRQGRDVVLAR
jgi:hypothetical protein